MPPRGNQRFDFTPIVTHYLFLVTTLLAVIGWFTAFISLCIATFQLKTPQLNPLWFAIFLQLFVILGVFYILATDSIAMHRLQISVFGAIAIVFTVQGVTIGIFSSAPSLNAMGAGWLVLSIVNIIWVLYFTSEEDSLVLHIFNMLGTGGLTPPSRRRRTRTQSSIHNMQGGNVYSANYSSGGIGSHDFDAKPGTVGYVSPNANALHNQNSFGPSLNDNSKPFGSVAGAGSIREQASGGAVSIPDNDNGAHSPLIAGVAPGAGISSTPSAVTEPLPTEAYAHKARAMYSYSANPEDPNEITFLKGEVLDIIDQSGKWWRARKDDGSQGIAPSNYLQPI